MTDEQKLKAFEERALELTVDYAPKHEYTDPESGKPCFNALGFARDLLKALTVEPDAASIEYFVDEYFSKSNVVFKLGLGKKVGKQAFFELTDCARAAVRLALTSKVASAKPVEPEGWKLVPVVMTAAMIHAWSGGNTVTSDNVAARTTFQYAWQRVLAVTNKPESK